MQQILLLSQKNIEVTLQTVERFCPNLNIFKCLKNVFVYFVAMSDVFSQNKQIEDQFGVLDWWKNEKFDLILSRVNPLSVV